MQLDAKPKGAVAISVQNISIHALAAPFKFVAIDPTRTLLAFASVVSPDGRVRQRETLANRLWLAVTPGAREPQKGLNKGRERRDSNPRPPA
jgi:hypothetical protein